MLSEISCIGGACPIKEECQRYVPRLNKKKTDWLVPPFVIIDGKVVCHWFVPIEDNKVMEEVKRILCAETKKNKDQ